MQYYTFYILYDNIYSINTMKITFEIFYSVKKRESLVNCDIQALNKIRTRYKNWPYLVFIAMLPTVETRIVINDVVAGAHYDVEVIRANAELLCICGSQPSWERLYHGRGNPSILGEHRVSPVYRPWGACCAQRARSYSAGSKQTVVSSRCANALLGSRYPICKVLLFWSRCNTLSKNGQPFIRDKCHVRKIYVFLFFFYENLKTFFFFKYFLKHIRKPFL